MYPTNAPPEGSNEAPCKSKSQKTLQSFFLKGYYLQRRFGFFGSKLWVEVLRQLEAVGDQNRMSRAKTHEDAPPPLSPNSL